MYITDSNQYTIELVTYLLVLVVYFYEFIVYLLLERNAFDSIAFFLSLGVNILYENVFHIIQLVIITISNYKLPSNQSL